MGRQYLLPHDWLITEEAYTPARNSFFETIFALGNGYMGVRGTPEEGVSGEETIPGTFLPLIGEQNKLHFDWARGGFPTQVTAMVTCPDWTPITLTIDGERMTPQQGTVRDYRRTLNLQEGTLRRVFVWEDDRGRRTEIDSMRIVCLDQPHLGAIRYTFRPLNYAGQVTVECGIDGEVARQSPPTEKGQVGTHGARYCCATTVTQHEVAMAMQVTVTADDATVATDNALVERERYIGRAFTFPVCAGTQYTVVKYIAVCTGRDVGETGSAGERAISRARQAREKGFDRLLARHIAAWAAIWREHDVVIDGDSNAQQGIRYCLANLVWNYAGADPRLNVGAKGISGPGYGGLYFWDSETYLAPYYSFTEPAKARNMLVQRHRTLDAAKARAQIFGFHGAMYPLTCFEDGEDCASPWELGMLEQHIVAAVPYAIRHYVEATGDEAFLWQYGAEMVIEVCRFWASRVCFCDRRRRYVINTVTGPDEYTMVVNNNCYTNSMAQFNLKYGLKVVERMRKRQPAAWTALAERLAFDDVELGTWRDVAARMYIGFDNKLGIHAQDDTFLDLDPVDVQAIPDTEKPLLAHWPWERIIRCQVLKQPDVLLLMYLLNAQYSPQVKLANYRYYEPKTTHDSSLSPCIHAILAAELGLEEQAFAYYLRTARLDLDDVNFNTNFGVHIAGMAGSWMSIVHGFAGMRVQRGRLSFTPHLPKQWQRVAFAMKFHNRTLSVEMTPETMSFRLQGRPLSLTVAGQAVSLKQDNLVTVPLRDVLV